MTRHEQVEREAKQQPFGENAAEKKIKGVGQIVLLIESKFK